MVAFVVSGEFQVLGGGLLRLLDESVEQHHSSLLINIEKHSRDAILIQARPYFVNAIAYWSTDGHPKRPTKFNRLDILTDPLAIIR